MIKRLHFWWPSKVPVTNYPEDLNSDFYLFSYFESDSQ